MELDKILRMKNDISIISNVTWKEYLWVSVPGLVSNNVKAACISMFIPYPTQVTNTQKNPRILIKAKRFV